MRRFLFRLKVQLCCALAPERELPLRRIVFDSPGLRVAMSGPLRLSVRWRSADCGGRLPWVVFSHSETRGSWKDGKLENDGRVRSEDGLSAAADDPRAAGTSCERPDRRKTGEFLKNFVRETPQAFQMNLLHRGNRRLRKRREEAG